MKKSKTKSSSSSINVYCDDRLEVFNNFQRENNDDKDDIEVVLEKFKTYCEPRKNSLIE